MRELIAQAEAKFAEWLRREMPPDTYIADPDWWAPRIYRAVCQAQAEQPADHIAGVSKMISLRDMTEADFQRAHGEQPAEPVALRAAIDTVMAIPSMSDTQLEELKRNCRAAIEARKDAAHD